MEHLAEILTVAYAFVAMICGLITIVIGPDHRRFSFWSVGMIMNSLAMIAALFFSIIQ